MQTGKFVVFAALGGFLIFASAKPSYAAKNSGSGSVPCTGTDIDLTYSPTTLWPPNHKMQTITINGTDNDNDSNTATPQTTETFSIGITQITENQSDVPGAGCGAPTSTQGPDWTGVGNAAMATDPGTATTTAQVRSERCGNEGSRVYTITVTCMEMGGNDPNETTGRMGSADLTVTVPHDQGH
jgi:hypothetical protein